MVSPRAHTASVLCSRGGSGESIVLSVPWRVKDFVHCGLRLPVCSCPAPERTLEEQSQGLSWPRTVLRLLSPLLQVPFWNFTSPVAQYQAPPIPHRFSVVLEPGLVFTAGLVVAGGRVWLGFSMEMNSFSQALGWVGCALGAPGQPVPFQQDG